MSSVLNSVGHSKHTLILIWLILTTPQVKIFHLKAYTGAGEMPQCFKELTGFIKDPDSILVTDNTVPE